jgi:hypothetical protein
MDYATVYGKDEVLKAINGQMDDVVAAQNIIPIGSQTKIEQEFFLLRKELLEVIGNVEGDQDLVTEILKYACEAAKEIEAGATEASSEVSERGFALYRRILVYVGAVIDDDNRRTLFMTKLNPIVQSYIVHKFGHYGALNSPG